MGKVIIPTPEDLIQDYTLHQIFGSLFPQGLDIVTIVQGSTVHVEWRHANPLSTENPPVWFPISAGVGYSYGAKESCREGTFQWGRALRWDLTTDQLNKLFEQDYPLSTFLGTKPFQISIATQYHRNGWDVTWNFQMTLQRIDENGNIPPK